VKLGTEQDGLQVITEGLQRGERVIISGLQKVRPDMVVKPWLVPMPTPPSDRLPQTPPKLINTPPPPRNKR
jgi:hypothetical protein